MVNKVVVAVEVLLIQVGVVLLAPVILPLLLLGSAWRWIVTHVGVWGEDLFAPVAHTDLVFITDSIEQPHSAYLPVYVLKGTPSKERVVRELWRVYNQKDEKGVRCFWRLATYPSKWMGYWFWKKVDGFQIENQVTFMEDWKLSTEQDAIRLLERVIRRRFPPNSPWWDITIATNYLGRDKSLVIFRTSHAVMDGYSFIKLCFRISGIDQMPSDVPVDTSTKRHQFSPRLYIEKFNFLKTLMTEGLTEYLAVWHSIPQYNIFRQGQLCIGSPAELPSGDWICALTPKIPLDHVKVARKAFATSFYCIVFSAVMGGLRSFAQSLAWDAHKLPDSVKTLIALSKPDHPDNTLCNHWRPTIIDLPLGAKDTPSTIRAMHSVLEKGKISTYSEFNGVIFRLLELFPLASHINSITEFGGLTLIGSIASSSNELPPIFGQDVEELFHLMPINRENVAVLAWGCFSSNGHLRIGLTAEKQFFPKREHVQHIANCINQEFSNIYRLAQNLIDNDTRPIN